METCRLEPCKFPVITEEETPMNLWTLPVLEKLTPNNVCGECKECCTVLPITEADWTKPAGKPCEHLCDKGCSIYQQPNWPKLCRTYLCGWRATTWLGTQPEMRPDKLGVVFQQNPDVLALFETRPEAAYQPKVAAVVRKFVQKFKGDKKLRVNLYPYKGLTWHNEEIVKLGGVCASDAAWMLHREPYEHFLLEKIESIAKMNAKILLDFFTSNPHRQECVLGVPDSMFNTTKTVPRTQTPTLEAFLNGEEPTGELEWLGKFPLLGLTNYSGGTRMKSMD
jgi:hypothetical protein